MVENNFYVYIYLDPRKPGDYIYGDLKFNFEPFYVGKGKNRRISSGIFDKKNKSKFNKINKIKKSGLKLLTKKLYENLNDENAKKIEIKVIDIIGRVIKNNGPLTNFSDGGTGGDNISNNPNNKKIREKMSNSQRGEKNNFYGMKHTDETKKILSKIGKKRIGDKNTFYGMKHTDETKKKIGEKNKTMIGEKNHFYGKHHTKETKKIMRNKRLGKKVSIESRRKISETLKKKGWGGQNNSQSTKYIVETPEGEILEFIGRIELSSKLKGLNPIKIITDKEHNGYKLLNKIKINSKKNL